LQHLHIAKRLITDAALLQMLISQTMLDKLWVCLGVRVCVSPFVRDCRTVADLRLLVLITTLVIRNWDAA